MPNQAIGGSSPSEKGNSGRQVLIIVAVIVIFAVLLAVYLQLSGGAAPAVLPTDTPPPAPTDTALLATDTPALSDTPAPAPPATAMPAKPDGCAGPRPQQRPLIPRQRCQPNRRMRWPRPQQRPLIPPHRWQSPRRSSWRTSRAGDVSLHDGCAANLQGKLHAVSRRKQSQSRAVRSNPTTM